MNISRYCVILHNRVVSDSILTAEKCNMKKWLLVGVMSISVLEMTGCTPGNNTMGATCAGALAGGLIGNQIFRGEKNSFAGVLAGALIGGIVGNRIGNYMDEQDRTNMQSAIVNTPVNQQATCTSDKTGPNGQPGSYTVRPIKSYHAKNPYCREYQTTVTVGGKAQQAYGKACRQPDGS